MTTWFRKHFTAANPTAFSALLLRLVRDDGAVVYLNGTEIARDNMPPGPPTATTLASATADGADESSALEFVVPMTALVAGDNVLAVELHQVAANSDDLGFDAELLGLAPGTANFFLTSPAAGQAVTAAAGLPLSVYADPALGVTTVEFFAGPAKIGDSSSAPAFAATWTTPLKGTYPIVAKAKSSTGDIRLQLPGCHLGLGCSHLRALRGRRIHLEILGRRHPAGRKLDRPGIR